MKRIYLLRHAKSSWDEPGLVDHDRPLAQRGRRAAALLADHVRQAGIRPQLVLCSSSVRTRQTLDALGKSLGKGARVEVEDELYGADAASLLGRIKRMSPDVESVMLIGHNPGLQDLGLELAGRGADLGRLHEKFPTGALATLAFDGAWRELGGRGAVLEAYIVPRELRG